MRSSSLSLSLSLLSRVGILSATALRCDFDGAITSSGIPRYLRYRELLFRRFSRAAISLLSSLLRLLKATIREIVTRGCSRFLSLSLSLSLREFYQ